MPIKRSANNRASQIVPKLGTYVPDLGTMKAVLGDPKMFLIGGQDDLELPSPPPPLTADY